MLRDAPWNESSKILLVPNLIEDHLQSVERSARPRPERPSQDGPPPRSNPPGGSAPPLRPLERPAAIPPPRPDTPEPYNQPRRGNPYRGGPPGRGSGGRHAHPRSWGDFGGAHARGNNHGNHGPPLRRRRRRDPEASPEATSERHAEERFSPAWDERGDWRREN